MESKRNKSVLVIGGGVAGMAAAQTLAGHGVFVNLVEKESRLGGHAAFWACMATDSCRHCAACLGCEMAAGLPDTEKIDIHFNTKVTKIIGEAPPYTVNLNNGTDKTIDADNIIIATGFTPAVVPGLLGQAHQRSNQVITTRELNQMLKNETPPGCLPVTGRPRLGFIQCVGSRDRELNKDYCSQVCCKVSLRQIDKLLHMYPDARITLYYIDLQIIGKQVRSEFARISKQITLVQGVPREIFQNGNGQVCVIHEDPASGGRTRDNFDLMVLSTGIHAAKGTLHIAELMGIQPDPWGFLSNTQPLSAKGIYIAGCAKGPTDIMSAKRQGIDCAVDILEQSGMVPSVKSEKKPPVAVIGDGRIARETSLALINGGYPVTLFGAGTDKKFQHPNISCRPGIMPMSITGSAGGYSILFMDNKKTRRQRFAAIVAATSSLLQPAGRDLNLSGDVLCPLGHFLTLAQTSRDSIPERLCFWLDYSGPEHKKASRQILKTAIGLRKENKQVYFIMEKMLVHALEGQLLYDNARALGITFLRIKDKTDVLVQEKKKAAVFSVRECTLNGLEISFKSDWLILPEKRQPSGMNPLISHLLKEDLDTEGLLQSANIRHRPTGSPKRGIFFTGPCHDETDDRDVANEMKLILWSLDRLTRQNSTDIQAPVEIDKKKCRKCLTCLRTCPHGAVILEQRNQPIVSALACQGCGLCVTSCPALAIDFQDPPDETESCKPFHEADVKAPITVFACQNSAAIAARKIRITKSIHIQTVPCACSVSLNLLLRTLEKGSKKIILATCHHENCHSVKGHKTARIRSRLLGEIPGIDPSYIAHYPVAAGESASLESFLARQI